MNASKITEASENLWKADEAVGRARNELDADPTFHLNVPAYNEARKAYEVAYAAYGKTRDA